ncbi:Protein SAWADEE HOMEODOMAIN-like 2 [Sarracenia purpurea var. burkii]
MGRPPSNGGPSFRFNQTEVSEMEAILQEHNTQMPAQEVLVALADKFSSSAERSGKIVVQMKQVWNWFQNRRYALRAKAAKASGKLSVSPMPRDGSIAVRNVPQALQSATAPSVQSVGRTVSDNSPMEFEAKSARDGAWYDVATFLSHRSLETAEPDVLVRFAGFGPEEDEWVNVRRHVRQRSLPCESSECVAVLPGDLTLCFQEGKEQALYFDAHVLDAQRRRHDVRGCRCRFLVRYDHDQSEEIVPLRKICRRPETDYRLQQLHAATECGSVNKQKTGADPHTAKTLPVFPPTEPLQKQQKAEELADASPMVPPTTPGNVPVTVEAKVLQPKTNETSPGGDVAVSMVPPPILQPKTDDTSPGGDVAVLMVPPPNTAVTSGGAIASTTSTSTNGSGQNMP